MDDIEDMVGDEVGRADVRFLRLAMVAPKPTFIERSSTSNRTVSNMSSCGDLETSVPGTQLIWMKTYGCSHNVSDSEYMQGVLASYGYRFTEDPDTAQLWLLNSCTVKDPSQAAFMHLVVKGRKQKKAVVVAGCVPQADRYIKGLEDVSIVGIQQVDRVVEVVEETLKGHTVRLLAKNRLPELDLPKIRKNPMVEIIPLSTGCLGACTYCKTRHARGKLGSYTPEAIVARADAVINEGVTEIWLSSEDTGAYGIDIGTDLPTLLHKLLQVVPDGVMLRLGMTNPPYILNHLNSIAQVLNHDRVYSFLHVPVQSGSDEVLLAMKREYTTAEFRRVADELLAKVPDLTLATDIICGFPTETEAQFDETMELVEKYRFHIMNISQFYPRPGTPAAKMKRVPTQVVKDRSRRLTKLFETFDPYSHMVGRTFKVWVNTEVSDDKKYTVAHTKNYTKVLFSRDDSLIGCTAEVHVLTAARFHVIGKVLSRTHSVNDAAAAIRKQICTEASYLSAVVRSGLMTKTNLSNNHVHTSKGEYDDLVNESCGNDGRSCCSINGNGKNSDVDCGSVSQTMVMVADESSQKEPIESVSTVITRLADKWNCYIREDKVTLLALATLAGSISVVTARLLTHK
ncbi:hypothetical protein CCR75_004738 [Bremia lactucae]|uniref:Threonylcarbamoyladenosine tRNA methylthiotransferase n=1 Tax=Bremia lactucae TaxID=4779 RepID=A0A976NZV2_BRELC|nr:hypothetical protein CCR75_004738 [Bremia lactucae]